MAPYWIVFGGWILALMGAALACDASGLAKSVGDWGGRSAGAPRGLTAAYRLVGAGLAAAGAVVVGCAAAGSAWTRAVKVPGTGRPRLDGGVLVVLAVFLAGLKRGDLWRSKPRTWMGQDAKERGLAAGEKLAVWSSWALIASFALFGAYLMLEPGGMR